MVLKHVDNILDSSIVLELDEELMLYKEVNDEFRIWISRNFIHIPQYSINVFSASYESYNTAEGIYEVDFDYYIFFHSQTNLIVYEEQGSSLEVCIYNYEKTLET